ncbi:MAG: DAK2 domain-containing protein [Clostridia bacterium]|nr:DAK2 domain-containing protein [Clostridia bacterium]
MSTSTLDGKLFYRMMTGGASVLSDHIEELNALNVFPVSDGDTGTNMMRTMEGGLSSVDPETANLADAASRFARGALLSARGNSGVILSQIFAGISEGLKDCSEATAETLAEAYRIGVRKAYDAVQNPTEGTILTVFRESTEFASEHAGENSDLESFFENHLREGSRSLSATPELLPVLKEAGVVDSGASGYLYIAEGMAQVLEGKQFRLETSRQTETTGPDISRFGRDSKLEFGYCTEFLLRLTTNKVDPDSFRLETVLSDLKELGGESVVAYQDGDLIKVHVHTFTPGKILDRIQAYGEFLTLKIENMSLGHTESRKEPQEQLPEYTVVAVAHGSGMADLFRRMGANAIIPFDRSESPSTEQFLEAFRSVPSKQILVLPNHKNSFLAAEQAANLAPELSVTVLRTKTFMQGYGALAVISPMIRDPAERAESAQRAADGLISCEVSPAVRDATIGGVTVRCGQFAAIRDGSLCAAADTAEEAVMEILGRTDLDTAEIITLIAGSEVAPDEAASLCDRITETYPDLECEWESGGQDGCPYYFSIE